MRVDEFLKIWGKSQVFDDGHFREEAESVCVGIGPDDVAMVHVAPVARIGVSWWTCVDALS